MDKKKWLLGLVVGGLVFGLVSPKIVAEEVNKTSELVGYWKFDEGKGDIVKDYSGKSNNGRIYGATWVEKGLSFDGVDDYVDCGNDESLNLTQEVTVEVWLNIAEEDFPQLPSYRYREIINKGMPGHRWDGQYSLAVAHSRVFYFFGKPSRETDCSYLNVGTSSGWHHLVGVFQNGSFRIYLDGTLRGEKFANFTSLHSNKRPLLIGGISSKQIGLFKGIIGEVKIYQEALSSEEIEKSFKENVKRFIPEKDISSFFEYQPAIPLVEKPDPQIEKSWQEIDKYKLAIVPCPKTIKVKGEPIPIDSKEWVLVVKGKGIESGIEEINRVLKEKGGSEIVTGEIEGKNSIIIGTFETLSYYLGKVGSPKPPKRQGYIIRFYEEQGKERILIAGADIDGARYGCITLSMLVKDGPAVVPADITDWPDYKYRMAFYLPNSDYSSCQKVIDKGFRAKINLIWGPGTYTTYEKLLGNAADWKKINEYAKERSIKISYGGWWDVGPAPYPLEMGQYDKSCYPYKDMLGHFGRAYTWGKDELLTAKGELLAMFMRETGASAFTDIHPIDDGGIDNPENWSYRGTYDRKRFRDDQRAEADANVLNIFYREIKKANPDVLFCPVIYPYHPSYFRSSVIVDWIKKLSELTDKEIYFCTREYPREGLERWKELTSPHGIFLYYAPYPWSYMLFFSSTGRFARHFYFGDDKEVLWFFSGVSGDAQLFVAGEYMWNTMAPGWGWLPPRADKIVYADSNPKEVEAQLLPRITTILYGAEVSELIAKVCSQNLSCRLTYTLYQFAGAPPVKYFKSKYEAAEKSLVWLEEAEKKIKEDPFYQENFKVVKDFVTTARHLLEARYRYYLSREYLANRDYQSAEEEVKKAKTALSHLPENNIGRKAILEELDISPLKGWYADKTDYLKQFKPVRISIGLYSVKSSYEGVQEGFAKVPGLEVSTFTDPTKETLEKYDVIIFPATTDIIEDPREDWRKNIREFVENGGGVIFSHNAVGKEATSGFCKPIFPKICAGYGGQIINTEDKLYLTVCASHPAVGDLEIGKSFAHEYYDHLWIKPGPEGEIILKDSSGNAVMVIGQVGKGRVIYTGEIFGHNRKERKIESIGTEWKILFRMVRWAAGKEK